MRCLIIYILLAFFTKSLAAQNDTLSVPPVSSSDFKIKRHLIPEFRNRPLYIDIRNNSLVELEKPIFKTKVKGAGFAKSGYYMVAVYDKSPVRIKKTDTLIFIARVTPGSDPTDIIELSVFSSKGNKRKTQVVTEIDLWNNTAKNPYERMSYSTKKVAEGVYLLLIEKLNPGEYFFAVKTGLYAFGIDE
jgi:hypothetical protein